MKQHFNVGDLVTFDNINTQYICEVGGTASEARFRKATGEELKQYRLIKKINERMGYRFKFERMKSMSEDLVAAANEHR